MFENDTLAIAKVRQIFAARLRTPTLCNVSDMGTPTQPEEARIWLPRINQLFNEIEKRYWKWSVNCSRQNHGEFYMCSIWESNKPSNTKDYFSGCIEESIAQALLWILEQ